MDNEKSWQNCRSRNMIANNFTAVKPIKPDIIRFYVPGRKLSPVPSKAMLTSVLFSISRSCFG